MDTICLHGDGATAVQMANAVRNKLEISKISVGTFRGRFE
ncbi:LamB/YcsF family protein [Ascidiaceihabitans sp.]|nr:LamB/YcsF family protein [Ascidiaceihabitans sp.]